LPLTTRGEVSLKGSKMDEWPQLRVDLSFELLGPLQEIPIAGLPVGPAPEDRTDRAADSNTLSRKGGITDAALPPVVGRRGDRVPLRKEDAFAPVALWRASEVEQGQDAVAR
jgi:hypothetical protein